MTWPVKVYWLEEQVELVKQLALDGASSTAICEALAGRFNVVKSPAAINHLICRLEIARAPIVAKGAWSEAADALLTELLKQGVSHTQISRRLAVELGERRSRNACIGRAMRLGLSGLPRRRTGDNVPKARALPRPKPAPKPKIVAVNDDAPVLEPLEKVGEVWPLTPRARPMLELAARDCKFPVGEATGADLLHCGEATEEGCVYCAAHAAIAFLPQAARKERDFKRAYLRLASL